MIKFSNLGIVIKIPISDIFFFFFERNNRINFLSFDGKKGDIEFWRG